MVLAIYAQKCDVNIDILRADAMSLLELLEDKTTESDNHFTEQDIEAAIKNAKRVLL